MSQQAKNNLLFYDYMHNLGGAQISTITLYQHLRENGYKVNLLLHKKNDLVDRHYPSLDYSTLFERKENKVPTSLWSIWSFRNFLQRSKTSHIIVYSSKSLLIALIANLLNLNRSKIVYYFRGWGRKNEFSFLRRKMFLFINKAVTVSEETRRQVLSWLKKDCSCVYTSIDFSDFKRNQVVQEYNNNYDFRFCFVGSIIKLKGLREIVKELKILSESKKIHLDVIGDAVGGGAYYGEVIQLLKDSGFSYHLHGRLSPPYDFIGADTILLSNSSSEGLPRVISEAIYCGQVVIANPVGGIIDLQNMFPERVYPCHFNNDLIKVLARIKSPTEQQILLSQKTIENIVSVSKQSKLFYKSVVK